ncbi:MAG: hypothetical protein WB791_00640 [Waddliaceae bacterium]
MINLKDFFINKDALEKVNNEEVLMQYLEEGKPLQELFGFSNEATAEFYGAAKRILEQKRFEDAMSAFVFLTTINPYISDFWLGLGMAQQKNQEHEAALSSYRTAFTLEGRSILPYMLAAHCCLEIKDFDRAKEVLECAEDYADEHAEEKECRQLREDLVAAKHYINGQKKKMS